MSERIGEVERVDFALGEDEIDGLVEGLKNLAELPETLPPPPAPPREPARVEMRVEVALVKVGFTKREIDALDRVARYYGLSREEVLKRIAFREDAFGQASRARVAAGVSPIY